MELINLRDASLKYQKPIEIETALAWNSIKKILKKNNKLELWEYIKAVKITEKTITIITNKPIAKSELNLIKEEIFEAIKSSLEKNYNSINRSIKIL